jgi:hypothetical protein
MLPFTRAFPRRNMVRKSESLAAVLLGVALLTAPIRSTDRVEYRGVYTNMDYGFSVDIPSGLVGTGTAPGAPNHGFVLELPGGARIEVQAFYINPDDRVPFPPVLTKGLPVRTADGVLLRDELTWLSGLRAERTLTRVGTESSSRETTVVDRIVAVRKDLDGNPYIRYEISLTARSTSHAEYGKTLSKIIREFRLMAAP